MSDWLQRYQAGECAEVWAEMDSLGVDLQKSSQGKSAEKVALETMERSRKNVLWLFDGLQQTQGNAYVQRLVSNLQEIEQPKFAVHPDDGPTVETPFAGARVHADAPAAAEAERLGARAFTQGQDIYFNAGEYAPDTPRGQKLLAHELAHVVQLSRNGPAAHSGALEREAENAESSAVAGMPIQIEQAAGTGVHRKEKKEEPSVARHAVEIVPLPANGVISAAGHFSVSYAFGSGDPIVLTLQVPSQRYGPSGQARSVPRGRMEQQRHRTF